MTDLRAGAQQALEALHYSKVEAITALREALAQPEQEPVVFYRCNGCGHAYEQVHPTSCDCMDAGGFDRVEYFTAPPAAQLEQEQMRMPKVGDKVICLEDESLGKVVSLTAGGSPDITFDDGSRGTYLMSEFAELFGYVAPPAAQQEPTQWRDMVVVSLVREGIDKHRARELADHFAAQRTWVGLTEQDMPSGEDPMFDHQYFCAGMVYAAKVLQEKNT